MSLEPLADYLEPDFGNIYEYIYVKDPDDEPQPWTPELTATVTHYLVHEVSDDGYTAFLKELEAEVPAGSREAQADTIIKRSQAWHIAHAFHLAAVKAVPTLGDLIGHLEQWENSDQKEDVGEWLDAHTSENQRAELAEFTDHPEWDPATPSFRPEPAGWHFAWTLTPSELLQAWHQVAGPAPSDLTDVEWQLLEPSFAQRRGGPRDTTRPRTAAELATIRRYLDGMRYKFASDIPWSKIPRRYGDGRNIYERYGRYRDAGDFGRMLNALRSKPGATHLVEWLTITTGKADTTTGSATAGPSTDAPAQLQPPSPDEVRTWARANGYHVGERGRLPRELVQRYEQATRAA